MDSLEAKLDKLYTERKPDVYCGVEVAPLVEIFSITVHCDDNQTPSQVYGRISVSENKVRTFDLFCREEDNPQSVSSGGSLMLTAPLDADDAVIIPSELVTLDVQLYDRARHSNCIASGSITLNRVTDKDEDDWLEDYQVKHVPGDNNWIVRVHYAIFPYAVSGTVNVLFLSKENELLPCQKADDYLFDDDDDWLMERFDEWDISLSTYDKHDFSGFANLYGTVAASGVNAQISNRSSVLLFSKPSEESVCVKSGRFVELSRSVVAAPACSPLQVKVNLFTRDTQSPIAGGTVEFNATVKFKPGSRFSSVKKDIMGDDGSRIRIHVTWSDVYDQFYRVCRLGSFSPRTPKIKDRANEVALKIPKLSLEQSPSTVLSDNSDLDSSASSSENCILPRVRSPRSLMELYSVVVRGKELMPFKFYGTGLVSDDIGQHYFFSKDKVCPQNCPSLGMRMVVKGASHSFAAFDQTGMVVNLKDVNGDVVSSGSTCFIGTDQQFVRDMRMCSVIPGERAFAVLHYSVFPDGVSAEVEVKLNGKSLPGVVRGTIYARHGNCATTMPYQKKLFRSILFHSVHDGVQLDAPSATLPLVKSILSLPRRSYLIVKAKLSVSPMIQGDLVRTIVRTLNFKGNGVPVQIKEGDLVREVVQIKEGDLVMEVSVKFSEAY